MNAVYAQILEELATGEMNEIARVIFRALRKAYPEGRTRQWLIFDVYGVLPDPEVDLGRDVRDRKIRAVIAELRDRGYPIFSTSAEAGYRLDLSDEALGGMVQEFRSRRAKLETRIEAVERVRARARHLAGLELPRETESAQQIRMPL